MFELRLLEDDDDDDDSMFELLDGLLRLAIISNPKWLLRAVNDVEDELGMQCYVHLQFIVHCSLNK